MSAIGAGHAAGSAASNSIAAFRSVPVGRRQRQMLDAISELYRAGVQPSDQDLAAHLRWPINCVTPRRGELVEAGHVVKAGDKEGPTGRGVSWWRPAPAAPQGDLFARVPR